MCIRYSMHPLYRTQLMTGVTFLVVFFCSAASAQVQLERSVVASGGNSASGTGINISYSIGEPAVSTLSGGNSVLTQGYQQPDLLNVGMPESGSATYYMNLYPNPVKDHLYLEFSGNHPPGFQFEMIDISGKIVLKKKISVEESQTNKRITIEVGFLAPGSYLIRILGSEKKLSEYYKLIKTL